MKLIAALAGSCLIVGLAGCSGQPEAAETPQLPTTASPSASAAASEKAQNEAIATVADLEQMINVEVFAGTSSLNDVAGLASDPFLGQQRIRSQGLLGDGWRTSPDERVEIGNLRVVAVSPASAPKKVVIRYCSDGSEIKYFRTVHGQKQSDHGQQIGGEKTVVKEKAGWRVVQSQYKKAACDA